MACLAFWKLPARARPASHNSGYPLGLRPALRFAAGHAKTRLGFLVEIRAGFLLFLYKMIDGHRMPVFTIESRLARRVTAIVMRNWAGRRSFERVWLRVTSSCPSCWFTFTSGEAARDRLLGIG